MSMRIILSFLLGLFSFFYLAEFIHQITKRYLPSLIGLLIILLGFAVGFWGKLVFKIFPPLDILSALFLIGAGLGLTIHHLLSRRFILSERLETSFVRRHETLFERSLEILPGALTWTALTSPFWLALTLPYALAYLIIIAQLYWLFNALKIAVLIYIGFRRMDYANKQPWLDKLKTDFKDEWTDYYHLILIPTYNEQAFILKPAFEAIANSNYPSDKIFICLGLEERSKQKFAQAFEEKLNLARNFKSKLGGIFAPVHPMNLPGEIPGPGTNRNWMLKTSSEEFKKMKIDPKQVIVTTLDADFVISREFLAGSLHKYLSTPLSVRDKRTYTGVFFYYNNYWQAPTPMRLIAAGTAFWQLAEMVGSDKYQNYSSMSINMQTLLDIGGWFPNKVNDDSGFYWKAYFHFNGDYKVIPNYMSLSADAVLDVSLIKTFQNQYLQLKRWAYGVEHIPFIVKEYFKQRDVDFWDKTDKLIFVLWANARWGFLALFITFGGLLIPILNPEYAQSVLKVNLPIISSWILTAAFFGLFATIYVHEKTVPKRPANWSIITKIWSYIQWLLVPIVLVTISTIPAIDAQTSLMFGKYLEYRTTNKARLLA